MMGRETTAKTAGPAKQRGFPASRKPGYSFRYDPMVQAAWWLPLASIAAALLACAALIAMNGMNPLVVYMKMARGAFGSAFGISETLVKAIPLLLCGLGVAVAYRIKVWNIGAEGQLVAGAIAAAAVTVYLPGLPGPLYIPVMTAAGIAAGAVWGLFTALPRAYVNVNELITSLMLNYVALLLLDYLVFGPWRDPNGFNFPGTPVFAPEQQLMTFQGTRLHYGMLYALAAAAMLWFALSKTRWGYEIKLLGSNPLAARQGGIGFKRHVMIVMIVSGGLAGLAGMSEVSGVAHRLMYGISPGYGYTAIIVAWLAKLNPWAMIPTSVFVGGLIVGGYSVQSLGLPSSLSSMLQGAILICLIAGDTAGKLRIRRKGE